MQTDIFKQYQVQPILEGGSLKLSGLSKLSKSDAQSVIQYAKANKQQIINGLKSELESKLIRGIEPMETCLHGQKCDFLDCYPGERPGCLRAMGYLFDLHRCPMGYWGPMTLAIGSGLKN
jgi:hypothetical protein